MKKSLVLAILFVLPFVVATPQHLPGAVTIESTREVSPLEMNIYPLLVTFSTTSGEDCVPSGVCSHDDYFKAYFYSEVPEPGSQYSSGCPYFLRLGIILKSPEGKPLYYSTAPYDGCDFCSTRIDYTFYLGYVSETTFEKYDKFYVDTGIYCLPSGVYYPMDKYLYSTSVEYWFTTKGSGCVDECSYSYCKDSSTLVECKDIDGDGCTETSTIQCTNGYCTGDNYPHCETHGNIECNSNADCNDGQSCTEDICINPGTTSSYCKFEPKDTDGDGVSDCDDLCPNEYGLASKQGCPMIACESHSECDDGQECTEDRCVNPGLSNSYCSHIPKDTDNDGIDDCNDACPNQAGSKNNNGCPETNWLMYAGIGIVAGGGLLLYLKKRRI